MTSELARRIAITIGALLIFRLGSHIPIAGISPQMQADLLLLFCRAPLSTASRSSRSPSFPILTAAIIIQLVAVVWGRLSALERSGEAGRRKIARVSR